MAASVSRLGWQPLRGVAATARPDPRKDRFSQSSPSLPTPSNPFKSFRQTCDRFLSLRWEAVGGRKTHQDSRRCQSKPSLQSPGALDNVRQATIARLLFIEGLFLLIVNGTVNGDLSSITLFISNFEHVSTFLYPYWFSLHIVTGQSQRQHVAESKSSTAQPTTSRRHVVSRWLGAFHALSQLSFSRLWEVPEARDSGVTERKGAGQTTTPGRGKASKVGKTPPVRRARKQADRPSAPRPRRTPSGNASDSSSSEPEAQGSKARTARRAKSKGLRYACPYLKRDPFHYLRCLCQHQESSRRVKQHLLRNHVQPIHCPTCNQDFETRRACDGHVRARGCVPGTHALPAGMTQDQQTQLEQITATSEDGKWFAMWRILFPDTEPPSSPYVEPDDLGGFVAGEVHRLLRPFYRVLLRPVMDDDQFDRHHALLVHNSSAYLSTFSGSLAGHGPPPHADGQPSSSDGSFEDWFQGILQEPTNTATRGFSPAMSPSAFLPQTPQAGSYTLPNDDGFLPTHSSRHTATSPATAPTADISVLSQQMANPSEDTAYETMTSEETSQLMWAFTAGQFPMVNNSQYTNTFPPVNNYQQANPSPSATFSNDFGAGPTNSHLDAGYPLARQIYGPELSQQSALTNFYGSHNPQSLRPTVNPQHPIQPQEMAFGHGQAYTSQSTDLGAMPDGFMNHFMNHYGDDNFTRHTTSSEVTGLDHAARHQPDSRWSVNSNTANLRGRRGHNPFEHTGSRNG